MRFRRRERFVSGVKLEFEGFEDAKSFNLTKLQDVPVEPGSLIKKTLASTFLYSI